MIFHDYYILIIEICPGRGRGGDSERKQTGGPGGGAGKRGGCGPGGRAQHRQVALGVLVPQLRVVRQPGEDERRQQQGEDEHKVDRVLHQRAAGRQDNRNQSRQRWLETPKTNVRQRCKFFHTFASEFSSRLIYILIIVSYMCA